MSRENVEALRGVYERWSRGDFTAGPELYDPHVLLITRADLPAAGRFLGIERISAYMREYLEPLANLTWTADEFIEVESHVVVVTRQEGTGRGSGLSVQAHLLIVWTFRAPAVIRIEFFADRAAALEAVGLREC